jgi:hypothetical protein
MIDYNEYFHLGGNLRIEASNPDIKVKDLTGPQKSRIPSYSWLKQMFGSSYNPDKLNYRDYNQMLNDPQVKAAERLITYSLLKKKYIITPASEDPQDVEVADFVRDVIENLRTPFRQVRKNLYTALPYGFAVSECNMIFKEIDGKSRIVWDTIKSLPISTIWYNCFDYDEYGDVEKVTQWVNGNPIPIPAEKCIIFAFDEKFGNKYGRAILRACYDDHFMKHQILLWAAVFLEKHEGPTVVGYEAQEGSSNPEEMQANIDSIHEGTAGFTGKSGEKYEILESQHRGEAFMDFINYHNHQIFQAFMIGSLLLGQAEAKGGSYAQSQTHAETLYIFLDGVHEDLANSIQERIRTLVDLNFTVTKYPKFGFEEFNQHDLLALLAALQPWADKFQIDTSSEWFRQLLKRIMKQYADIEVEDEFTEPQQQQVFPIVNGEGEPVNPEELISGAMDILNPTNTPAE